MDNTTQDQPLGVMAHGHRRFRRRREAHPEHIIIANETFERNDIRAKNLSMSERTMNRGDARGAPYVFLCGVKYRPVERHDAFILSSIQVRKPPSSKRRKTI
jgi:hypothetical protein